MLNVQYECQYFRSTSEADSDVHTHVLECISVCAHIFFERIKADVELGRREWWKKMKARCHFP